MKKIETSKKILFISYIVAIILTVIVVIGSFIDYDMTNITTIASLAWGEVAASNIFYFKKSAKENVPTVIASLDKNLQNQIDINQLLNN